MELGTALAYYVKAQGSDPALHEVRRGEDGQVYIARWEHPFPQPTEAELEAAYFAAAKNAKKQAFSDIARDELGSIWTLAASDDADSKRDEFSQILLGQIAALCDATGVPLDSRLQAVRTKAQKLQQKHAAIEVASSEAELEAIEWSA